MTELLSQGISQPTPPLGVNTLYLVITVGAMLASWLTGAMLQRRFREYSMRPIPMTGAQVAQRMLRDYGIGDVRVISTPGQLTDHYNPLDKTVNLSEVVYHEANVAAAAVAAHECGHAVQHAQAYAALKLRSALVPVVSLSSRFMQYVLIAGLVLASSGGGTFVLAIGVVLFATTTLFSIVTLPVEFDASRRALAWLDQSRALANLDHDKAKNALFWAAMTYTVAALASIGQLLYYVFRLLEARR
jgi:Zn-dependent membrane protease YugP